MTTARYLLATGISLPKSPSRGLPDYEVYTFKSDSSTPVFRGSKSECVSYASSVATLDEDTGIWTDKNSANYSIRQIKYPRGTFGPSEHSKKLYASQLKKYPVGIVRNPQGFKQQQINSAEFKKWFKSSKVVDASGSPLQVYHGTSIDIPINVFSRKIARYETQPRSINAIGTYFTTSPKDAGVFAGGHLTGERIMPVYLSIQNPYHINNANELLDLWVKLAEGNRSGTDGDPELFRRKMEAIGYDGMVMDADKLDDFADFGSKYWVAFEPEQIKSSTANSGAFNSNNPDIRYNPSHTTARYLSVTGVNLPPATLDVATIEAVGRYWRQADPDFIKGMKQPVSSLQIGRKLLAEIGVDKIQELIVMLTKGGVLEVKEKMPPMHRAKDGGGYEGMINGRHVVIRNSNSDYKPIKWDFYIQIWPGNNYFTESRIRNNEEQRGFKNNTFYFHANEPEWDKKDIIWYVINKFDEDAESHKEVRTDEMVNYAIRLRNTPAGYGMDPATLGDDALSVVEQYERMVKK